MKKREHTLESMNETIQAIRREFALMRRSRSFSMATGRSKRDLEHNHLCRLERLGHSLAADAVARLEKSAT